jgi:hypothetical protein
MGIMKQTKQLHSIAKEEKLGDVVNRLLEQKIIPEQNKFNKLNQCWNEILPAELAEHSTVEDITAGQLIVKVDAPSYRYELQLCSADVLKQLQFRCSAVHVKRMKIVIG